MSESQRPGRRTLMVGLAVVGLAPLAGCMTKPLRAVNADGTYCYRIGKSYRPTLTCTPTPVPTDAVEAEAKRFQADPTALTVYLLRNRWADTSVVVPVTVDGAASAATIPVSLVRLRLKPGAHRVSAQWEGRSVDVSVEGRAGDLRVVELVGSGWAWGTSFEWQTAQAESVKARAQASKLIADLDLRG
ncbi:MAG: hypothetical protein U5L74_11335 [Ideonella sp.]|nr:hypothetical protein [Ideonella sp.]